MAKKTEISLLFLQFLLHFIYTFLNDQTFQQIGHWTFNNTLQDSSTLQNHAQLILGDQFISTQGLQNKEKALDFSQHNFAIKIPSQKHYFSQKTLTFQ